MTIDPATADERCPFTDYLKTSCAHCLAEAIVPIPALTVEQVEEQWQDLDRTVADYAGRFIDPQDLKPLREAIVANAKREERERIMREVDDLPVTRTQSWMTGWDSVSKNSVLSAITGVAEPAGSPRKCGRDVGSRPYWMGEGQYDPCPCLLDKGHDGECKCEHTIGDKDAKD